MQLEFSLGYRYACSGLTGSPDFSILVGKFLVFWGREWRLEEASSDQLRNVVHSLENAPFCYLIKLVNSPNLNERLS